MEGINAIVTGELVNLSEQQLVSCDSSNSGCDGGLMDSAFDWVINNDGIDSASDYPILPLKAPTISPRHTMFLFPLNLNPFLTQTIYFSYNKESP